MLYWKGRLRTAKARRVVLKGKNSTGKVWCFEMVMGCKSSPYLHIIVRNFRDVTWTSNGRRTPWAVKAHHVYVEGEVVQNVKLRPLGGWMLQGYKFVYTSERPLKNTIFKATRRNPSQRVKPRCYEITIFKTTSCVHVEGGGQVLQACNLLWDTYLKYIIITIFKRFQDCK